MDYSDFLSWFFEGLGSVFTWIRFRLFPSFLGNNSILSNHLVFTFMGISIIFFVIEELIGLFTSFEFGGIFLRLFRVFIPHKYDIDYKVSEAPDYSKEGKIKAYGHFMNPFYRSKFTGKYFISYNGRYFPVRVPRYNPFAMRSFKAAYNSGKIISYDQIMKQNYKNSYNASGASPITASNISGSMSSSWSDGLRNNISFNRKLFNNINPPESEEDRDYLTADEVEGDPDFESENYVSASAAEEETFLHFDASKGQSFEDWLSEHGYSLDDLR